MYGLVILPENDPVVTTANQGLEGLVKAMVPGAFLVDTFPLCENMC